ncbi:MAG: hypothetical protein WC364_13485 [Eubacteriales bacterium]
MEGRLEQTGGPGLKASGLFNFKERGGEGAGFDPGVQGESAKAADGEGEAAAVQQHDLRHRMGD